MARHHAATRHRVLLLAGAGVLTFVIGAGVVASRGGETRLVVQKPAGAPAVPVEAAASPAPNRAVTLSARDGAVSLVDPLNGRRIRTLAKHRAPRAEDDPTLLGITTTPDHRFAYYSMSGGCGSGTLYRAPIDGRRKPEVVAQGIAPAVSPDGNYLAYAIPGRTPAGGGEACFNAIAVLDLIDNSIREWRYPDDEDHAGALFTESQFNELAWAPDSRRLAFTVSYEGDSMSILDTETMTDLGQSTEVVIPGGGGDSRHPAWQPGSGDLALVNRAFECCFDDDYDGPTRTVLLDLATQNTDDLLPPGQQPSALDFDATGEHLLYVDGDGQLWRRSRGQEPVMAVPAGVSAADWN
jgi:hypothetical protein